MTDVIPAEPMPGAVRTARGAMILQSGFGLFFFAMMAAAGAPMLLVALLPLLLLVVVALGGLAFRCSSRRKWVRWCAVAVEAVTVGGNIAGPVLDGEFGWRTLINLGVVLPLAVVIALLTPSAARWFDR
ncbi:hypothetical protein HTZ77_20190 [Nonomuraea sp. SMC257]|uniref:Uncharacterized protein n=1 Tax=Nonomuraea montanisoli TaxID=2741721 RepID=A0A7Y6M3Y8_9ACTN|nr:hypothetical protein [Nonomuraea montanisoli]NUW33737.1 hypothetical protein [Nonomuraea montanisoli]